ncbi:MAG: hypothetical protein M1812_002400 [Candelaria pacifica]|nr:MAG: hypothetical protein M1812_002400 [Candelaria pacifica]
MDGLSAAAGVISVVSLAIQLAESVHKVEEFWRSVKDAPSEVRDLQERLGLLVRILDEAENLETGPNKASVRVEALSKCRAQIDILDTIVEELKVGFAGTKTQRKWTSIKTVWKKDKISKSKKCLEEITQIFSLAMSTHQSEMQERNNKALTQRIDDLKVLVASSADEQRRFLSLPRSDSTSSTDLDLRIYQGMRKALLNPEIQDGLKLILPSSDPLSRDRIRTQPHYAPGSSPSRQDSAAFVERTPEETSLSSAMSPPYVKRTTVQRDLQQYALALAKIHYQTRLNHVEFVDEVDGTYQVDLDDRQEFEASVTIQPNRWISSRGFSISYSHHGQAWFPSLRFRQFNLRSEDSLIFEFCSTGNVDGVRSLFSRGEASPFDTDAEGWTPLHYAASAQHPALCKLLIHKGASGDAVTLSNISPLYLALAHRSGHLRNRGRETGSSISSTLESTLRVLVGAGKSNPSVEDDEGLTCYDLIRSERMCGSTALLTWLLRATSYDFDPDHRDQFGRTLLMRLADNSIAPGTLDSLLSLGANINARVTQTEQTDPRSVGMTALHFVAFRILHVDVATSTAKELLSRGADPHILSNTGESPTDVVLRAWGYQKFLLWYTTLDELGYDLKEFLREEIAAHAAVPWFRYTKCEEYVTLQFGFSRKYDADSAVTLYQSLLDEGNDDPEEDPEMISHDELDELDDEVSLFSSSNDGDVGSPTSEYLSAEEQNIFSDNEDTIERRTTTSTTFEQPLPRLADPRLSSSRARSWKLYRLLLKNPQVEDWDSLGEGAWILYKRSFSSSSWRLWNERHDELQWVLYNSGSS